MHHLISKDKINHILESVFTDISALGSLIFHILLCLYINIFSLSTPLVSKLSMNLIFTHIFSYIIRFFYFKERPNARHHSSFLERLDASSFPSIHVARFVGFSAIVSLTFYDSTLTLFLFILTILVAYSRIYLKEHHFIDTLFGGIIGLLIGITIYYI